MKLAILIAIAFMTTFQLFVLAFGYGAYERVRTIRARGGRKQY